MKSGIGKIVFIQTPCQGLEDDRLEPPLGLLYLAGWLEMHNFSVDVVDLSAVPRKSWIEYIPEADVYGFSTYTTSYHETLEIRNIVNNEKPESFTVAGGPHATALPEIVSRDFDFVVTGEGENAMLELMQALQRDAATTAVWQGTPVKYLDTLPFPDYGLTDLKSYNRVVSGKPSLSVMSSRGCPYGCIFCNSIVMGNSQPVRFRSAENVVEEIRQLKAEWAIDSIRFQDDIFTLNMPRLRALTPLLRDAGIVYRCFGRVDRCCEETAALLYEGGCRHIAFGVESGSDVILAAMHKGQTAADIRKGIANAKASGLIVRVYLIVGFPGETWDTIKETVNLMQECQPDEFSVYPLIPYPGTPLFKNPEKYGITSISHDYSQYYQVSLRRSTGYVFRSTGLNEDLVAEMRQFVIEELGNVACWAGDSKLFK